MIRWLISIHLPEPHDVISPTPSGHSTTREYCTFKIPELNLTLVPIWELWHRHPLNRSLFSGRLQRVTCLQRPTNFVWIIRTSFLWFDPKSSYLFYWGHFLEWLGPYIIHDRISSTTHPVGTFCSNVGMSRQMVECQNQSSEFKNLEVKSIIFQTNENGYFTFVMVERRRTHPIKHQIYLFPPPTQTLVITLRVFSHRRPTKQLRNKTPYLIIKVIYNNS